MKHKTRSVKKHVFILILLIMFKFTIWKMAVAYYERPWVFKTDSNEEFAKKEGLFIGYYKPIKPVFQLETGETITAPTPWVEHTWIKSIDSNFNLINRVIEGYRIYLHFDESDTLKEDYNIKEASPIKVSIREPFPANHFLKLNEAAWNYSNAPAISGGYRRTLYVDSLPDTMTVLLIREERVPITAYLTEKFPVDSVSYVKQF